MTRRLWGIVALGLAIGIGIFALAVWLAPQRQVLDTLAPDDFGRGDYRMTMTNGQPFTQDALKGQPSLVFFGFTHCPDICPTTLGDIALWQEELGAEADDLRVFMVSVDLTRDTQEVLAEYIGWLPGAVGVTGSEQESLNTQKAFRVFSRKMPLEGGKYTMDHSSSVLVFDRAGHFVANISYQSPLDHALERIRAGLTSG